MKKTNLILYIIIVIALCGITVYATYSFFSTSHNQSTGGTNARSGTFNITYDKGTDVIGGSLSPSTSKENGLSISVSIIKNANSIDSKYKILLSFSQLDEQLASSALKWELYQNGGVNSISNGNFIGATTSEPIILLTDMLLPTVETTYTLYIWLDGELATNATQNKTFLANFKIETYQINK